MNSATRVTAPWYHLLRPIPPATESSEELSNRLWSAVERAHELCPTPMANHHHARKAALLTTAWSGSNQTCQSPAKLSHKHQHTAGTPPPPNCPKRTPSPRRTSRLQYCGKPQRLLHSGVGNPSLCSYPTKTCANAHAFSPPLGKLRSLVTNASGALPNATTCFKLISTVRSTLHSIFPRRSLS